MAKLVFSSDWHLGHNAVLDLAHRPFGDVDAMAQYFVEQTNEICQADDRLFCSAIYPSVQVMTMRLPT